MNTTIHTTSTQQTEFIPSQGVPIIERPQGVPGGHGQGQLPETLQTTKDVRWSSHGVYYGTPKWRHWQIRMLPVSEMDEKMVEEKRRLERVMRHRLFMSFIYVWCFLTIIAGLFYYTSTITRSIFITSIAVMTVVLMVAYLVYVPNRAL